MTVVDHIDRINGLLQLARRLAQQQEREKLIDVLSDIRTDTQWLKKQIKNNQCKLSE